MGESQGVRPVDGLHPPDHHLVDLLEVRVGELVGRHREARRTIAELRAGLREREAEIAELQKRIQELERGRQEACERVDRLIDRIDLFEQGHDRDSDARAGDDR